VEFPFFLSGFFNQFSEIAFRSTFHSSMRRGLLTSPFSLGLRISCLHLYLIPHDL
jgi:hypothetical protein